MCCNFNFQSILPSKVMVNFQLIFPSRIAMLIQFTNKLLKIDMNSANKRINMYPNRVYEKNSEHMFCIHFIFLHSIHGIDAKRLRFSKKIVSNSVRTRTICLDFSQVRMRCAALASTRTMKMKQTTSAPFHAIG